MCLSFTAEMSKRKASFDLEVQKNFVVIVRRAKGSSSLVLWKTGCSNDSLEVAKTANEES